MVDCCHHQCSRSHAGGSTGGATYTVVSGDTLSGIANTHDTTVDAILAANPSITNPDFITPGKVITLPTATGAGG
jgi:LysM repeat protein